MNEEIRKILRITHTQALENNRTVKQNADTISNNLKIKINLSFRK